MGLFEPRISASNCGYREDVSYIQRCLSNGKVATGSGAAPGTGGRPSGQCFYPVGTGAPTPPPNMCTSECRAGSPSAQKEGTMRYCCADGASLPTLKSKGKILTCSCPAARNSPSWMNKGQDVLHTTKELECDTGCSTSKTWKTMDGVKYCCPSKTNNMALSPIFALKNYEVHCRCVDSQIPEDPEPALVEDAEMASEDGSGDQGDAVEVESRKVELVEESNPVALVESAKGIDFEPCYEELNYGICYRACSNMGLFEPRISASNCGYREDVSYIQRCLSNGKVATGSGAAPGTGGRPSGQCFYPVGTGAPTPPPNMCTSECRAGSPSAQKEGTMRYCCADGASLPTLKSKGKILTCSCPAARNSPSWMNKGQDVLHTTKELECDTGCSTSKIWKTMDGVKYCCPSKQNNMALSPIFALKNYEVVCRCA